MATEKKNLTQEERVELYIPRGQENDDPNLFIAVNGVSYLLPWGKKSMVPKHIHDEYMRSQEAQEIQYDKQKAMASKAPQ